MHKFVQQPLDACEQVSGFFTGQILQQKVWGIIVGLCALFANIIRRFYTNALFDFDLLVSSYTRFTQALLLELHIKLIKGL